MTFSCVFYKDRTKMGLNRCTGEHIDAPSRHFSFFKLLLSFINATLQHDKLRTKKKARHPHVSKKRTRRLLKTPRSYQILGKGITQPLQWGCNCFYHQDIGKALVAGKNQTSWGHWLCSSEKSEDYRPIRSHQTCF